LATAVVSSSAGPEELGQSAPEQKQHRFSSREVQAFLHNPMAMAGVAMLLSMIILSLLAPIIGPEGYDDQDLYARLLPPLSRNPQGGIFLLGSDGLGRDLLVRIAYGGRVSLSVSLIALAIGGGIGVVLGLLAGLRGGWFDTIVMRTADAQLAIPSLLLAIAVLALLGANRWTLLLVLSLRTWVVFARPLRSNVLMIKEQDFVLAARSLGAAQRRIAFRHILPEAITPVIIIATTQLGSLILLETTLSFLGLGIQPPQPSWGNMLSEGRPYITAAWWIPTMPGLAILITVMGANFVGDGLRDALDPRLKR
jgi:peptide/nickel transport system permease protein